MGLSIPFQNLKQYMWCDVGYGIYIADKAAGVFTQDIWKSDQDFSELSYLGVISKMSMSNINSDFILSIFRDTTLLKSFTLGGGVDDSEYWYDFVDISSVNGVHELSVNWDQDSVGALESFNLEEFQMWGIK